MGPTYMLDTQLSYKEPYMDNLGPYIKNTYFIWGPSQLLGAR